MILSFNDALHGYHVITLNHRAHGRSQPQPPPYRLLWFSEDMFEFIQAMNLSAKNLINVGYSLGGYALTYAVAITPKGLFRSLHLIDPGVFPRLSYGIGNQKTLKQ